MLMSGGTVRPMEACECERSTRTMAAARIPSKQGRRSGTAPAPGAFGPLEVAVLSGGRSVLGGEVGARRGRSKLGGWAAPMAFLIQISALMRSPCFGGIHRAIFKFAGFTARTLNGVFRRSTA